MYKAKLSNFRVSARKGRLVADMIRGKKVEEAQSILKFTINKTAEPVLKLLNSAAANAKEQDKINLKDLYVSKIIINEGPTYKRLMPRARGSADRIRKRTAHIEIELDKIVKDIEPKVEETVKAKKEDKKVKTKKNES